MGRKSNVCAHKNLGVPMKVLAVVCCSKISILPPIELRGHHGNAWRVINQCVPLVTDFMRRVYLGGPGPYRLSGTAMQ
jgi:hypothetical protein